MKSARFIYGCLMGSIVVKNWDKLFSDFIKPEDVYGTEKDGFGIEANPHVTILFGFHDDDPNITKKLKADLPSSKGIKGKLVGISCFETPDYDVVKFDIESNALLKLNKWCKKEFDYTNEHKVYHAHATIAYVKKGTGKSYKRKMEKSFDFKVVELIYSHPNKNTKREIWKIA